MSRRAGSGPGLTLPDALAGSIGGAAALVLHLEDGEERLSAHDIHAAARAAALRLAEDGVHRGDRVGILGPNRREWVVWAFGAWMLGAAVVPMPFPLRVRDRAALRERIGALTRVAGCRLVLAAESFVDVAPDGASPWDLPAANGELGDDLPGPRPDDLAVVQFTSGSTADPKGAMLTHRAVLASARNTSAAYGLRPGTDRFAAWLPLFHDWGLFGFLLRPLIMGCETHIMPTERFARAPLEWFRLVTRSRATITPGPSSAWAAVLRVLPERPPDVDLSGVRIAAFGAEVTDPGVIDRLREVGPAIGLRPEALCVGYGMAETVMGVTTTEPGKGVGIDRVDLGALTRGRAEPATPDGPVKRIVACGRPMPGSSVRVGEPGRTLPERSVGEILVRSEGLMEGYLGGDGPGPVRDGWLHTGDLGYLAGGELFVTGRLNDVVIVLGQNFAPEDIEWAAGRTSGVRNGRCVAFSPRDAAEGQAVVVVEPSDETETASLSALARRAIADAIGLTVWRVVVVPKDWVPKTTSGKLRRGTVREAHATGELESIALATG